MRSLLTKGRRRLGGLSRNRRTPVGLDMGMHTMRAVQLKRVSGGPGVSESAYEILAMVERQRTHDPEQVEGVPPRLDDHAIEDLRQLLAQGNFQGSALVTGLDSSESVAVALDLPLGESDLDDPRIRSALSFELSRHIGYQPEEAEFRAWRLPAGGTQAPTVMGVVARRDAVIHRIKAVEQAGFQCKRIDSESCALVRCCTVLCKPRYESIWGMLDIGLLASRLVVAVRDVPVLQREISASGAIWSYHVAEKLNLSLEAAEQIKVEHGITSGYRQTEGPARMGSSATRGEHERITPRTADGAPPDADAPDVQVSRLVFSALRKGLVALAVEVEKSMAYAMHIHGDLPVSTLYLAGGGSGLKGLPSFLTQELGIDVEVTDPLGAMGARRQVPRHGPGGAWTKAVGLALLS